MQPLSILSLPSTQPSKHIRHDKRGYYTKRLLTQTVYHTNRFWAKIAYQTKRLSTFPFVFRISCSIFAVKLQKAEIYGDALEQTSAIDITGESWYRSRGDAHDFVGPPAGSYPRFAWCGKDHGVAYFGQIAELYRGRWPGWNYGYTLWCMPSLYWNW